VNITEDILVSYAFGHLGTEEEAVVETHLNGHPEDAATVSGYLDGLTGLVLALPIESLGATGKTELLARVRSAELLARVRDADRVSVPTAATTAATTAEPSLEPTPPATDAAPPPVMRLPPEVEPRPPILRYAWLGALSAAVVALLYLTLSATLLDPDARTARALRGYEARPGATSYVLEGAEASDPLGTLVQLQDGRVFAALGAPPTGGVYQAWAIGDAAVSLGTFGGRTFLSPGAVAAGETFGVTVEPPGGSEQPTTTPLTLLEL